MFGGTETYLQQLTEGSEAWSQIETDDPLFWDNVQLKTEFKPEPCLDDSCYGNLLDVAKTAQETGSLLPLIKEELKCKIQAKRLAAGKEELDIKESQPKLNQLTEDDIRRRETRKAQNRRAAKRYRTKQRSLQNSDKQEKHRLERENAVLVSEVHQLRADKQRLITLLEEHQRQCLTPREAEVPGDWELDPMFFFN